MKLSKRFLSALLALLFTLTLFGCSAASPSVPEAERQPEPIDLPVYSPEATVAPITESSSAPTEAPTAEPTAVPSPEPAATQAPQDTPTPTDVPKPTTTPKPTPTPTPEPTACPVSEDGEYWTKDEVALYIHLFGHLPKNYITKSEAQALGWPGGSLEPYAPGCSIGGGYFGNYEGILPSKKGRKYTECDIDTRGRKSRGSKRIVFSNDGLIYYTDDHYESFTLLYGED